MSRFEPIRPLGRGAMGEVWLAHDREGGGEVALKRLPPELGDAESALRFAREAEALARVAHPALVRLVAWGQERGRPWLAMEHLPGGSLEERVRREGPLPEAEVAALGAALANGLAAVHAAGVLHRDVKPGNVLLDSAGAPRLVDFGLTRSLTRGASLTATGALLGTPAYMAPEQAQGDPRAVGPAADVYGLGATLYFLLTGEPPHAGRTPLEVITELVTRDPAPPSARRQGLDPGLERIVLRALARSPADRYPSAGALALALEGWAPGRAPGARRPLAAAPVVAGALLALAGAGLVVWLVAVPPLPAAQPSPLPAAPLPAAPLPAAPLPAAPLPAAPSGARPDVAAALARAEEALAGEDQDGLARAVDELLALDPDHPAALAWRVELRLQSGPQAVQGVLDDVARLLQAHPRRAEGWRLRAELDLLYGDLESAVRNATRALELEPDAAYTLVLRGISHLWQGARELARLDAERASGLELDARLNPGRLVNRARLAMAFRRWDAAAADLERLTRLARAAGPAAQREVELLGQALTARRAGRPGPAHALLAEAEVVAQRGDLSAAERLLREAAWGPDGHAWELRHMLAILAEARGDLEGASRELRVALAIHPDDPGLIRALGDVQARLRGPPPDLGEFARIVLALGTSGQRQPADQDLDAFVRAHPDHLEGLLLWAYRRRTGAVLADQVPDRRELAETLATIDRALALDPALGSATVHGHRAELCLLLGDLSRSREAIELAVALSPAEPFLHHKRGLVRARCGDVAAAREDLAWLEARARGVPESNLAASLRQELERGRR